MRINKTLKLTILLGFLIFSLLFTSGLLFFGSVFLFFGNTTTWAVSESKTVQIDPNAFVYILNMGIERNKLHFDGLRNGFAVGNGQYILTAAHCVADFENTNEVLRQPLVISPYYGDIFEAAIVAVDDVNDIAILKPAWDAHPTLELETSEEWKKCETLIVMGYPPPEPLRGGNGSTSRQILSEEVSLRYTSGKNAREVVVGPCRYPGVGWSGSPFINPKTGKVVGIFCRGDTYQSKKYIFFKKKEHLHSGPGVDSIRQFFNKNNLANKTTQSTMGDLNHRNRFEQILEVFDVFKPGDKQKVETALMDLFDNLPESYIANTLSGPAFRDPDNLSHFENAIKIAPRSSFVHAAYGNYLLACNLPKKAVEQFQIVTEWDPNHIFASYGLLSALVKTDPNAAEILGKELMQRWPDNAGFHFEYSKALRAQNKRKEELPVIQKSIELCGEGTVPFQYQRYLADSLKANKQYEKSEQAYQKLLKTHECDRCWWAYTTLLLKMGPDKIKEAKKARDKTMSFTQNPNTALEKQHIYEAALEKMLSDPNTISDPNH